MLNNIQLTDALLGSFESLMAAIDQGGASSVYFGIDQFNMRSRSSANYHFRRFT